MRYEYRNNTDTNTDVNIDTDTATDTDTNTNAYRIDLSGCGESGQQALPDYQALQ